MYKFECLWAFWIEDDYIMWWSWWWVGNGLKSSRTPTHAAQMLRAPRCDLLELSSFSSYLGGTTKASSRCRLHTSPAEPWESAEPVYSRAPPTASPADSTLLYCTFLINPTVPFQEWYYWKFHSFFFDETCFTFAALVDKMHQIPKFVSTCSVCEYLNLPLCSPQWWSKSFF